jgi:protein SCO1/2
MRITNLKFLRWFSLSLVFFGALLLAVLIFNKPAAENAAQPLSPLASLGGTFALTDHRGAPVSEKTFVGKPTLYFFGFTNCPDVCPTTLYDLSARLKELGRDADKLNIAFVTVDPERDTQEALADYMSAFDPRIVALTGTRAQVDTILKAYRVYAKKVPLENGNYTLDHSASIFAADSQGRVVMLIDRNESPEMVRTKLQRLLAEQ